MATVPMVDTNVVIYAMRKTQTNDRPDLRTMITMSTDLLRRLDKIRISAITHVEVMRALRPAERTNPVVQALFRRLQIMPLTAAAAERAVELLLQKNVNEKVCPRCLSAENDHPCARCNRLVASHQRLADAMIAATADTFDRDCVLYAFDTGVLAFKPYVKRCSIERPQESYGPLFAGAQASTLAPGPRGGEGEKS
jgi:predicted nucleic acid-binding protein